MIPHVYSFSSYGVFDRPRRHHPPPIRQQILSTITNAIRAIPQPWSAAHCETTPRNILWHEELGDRAFIIDFERSKL